MLKNYARSTKIIAVVAIMGVYSIKAQSTLQMSDLQTGLSFDIYNLSGVNSSDITPSGANVNWNLSAATSSPSGASVDFVDMASTGYASAYPTANFAMKFNSGVNVSYNFSLYNSGVWEELALNVGTSGVQNFINNRTVLVFPYTFGLSNTDTYQKTGQSANTITHNYDAYGTLNVGANSYSNLVRDMAVDNGAGTTQAIWWNTSPIYPVLVANNSGITLWKNSVSGINSINEKKLSFKLYPNPATNTIQIMNQKRINKIEIYDANGQLYITTIQSVIDITGLSSGLYFVKAYLQNTIETAKFIKE
ncbi:MAG: T9SS type A sorting domain-containing protein [Bacteroidia bacterium]